MEIEPDGINNSNEAHDSSRWTCLGCCGRRPVPQYCTPVTVYGDQPSDNIVLCGDQPSDVRRLVSEGWSPHCYGVQYCGTGRRPQHILSMSISKNRLPYLNYFRQIRFP
eukprot:6213576-Pleurochrysis_carterae.AAC.3